jgi:tetratricopeptide (TPR) repeat protein
MRNSESSPFSNEFISRIPYVRVLLFLIIPFLGLAQSDSKGMVVSSGGSSSGNFFGLVIGISDYTSLPKLNFADRDAMFFYEYLLKINPGKDSSNVALFVNKDATRDLITEKLYAISEKIKAGDKVVVYFSGHGDVEQLVQTDNSLLLLAEAPSKNYLRKSNSYLDINLFKNFFDAFMSKQAQIVFIIDACRSGGLIGGEAGKKYTLLSLQQSWANETKLLSCQANQESLEGKQWGGGRGLFSYYLMLGLKGLADADKNNEITLYELDRFLKDNVGASSSHRQIPTVQGDYNSVMSKATQTSIAEARREMLSSNAGSSLIASRGIRHANAEDSSQIIYQEFRKRVNSNELLRPNNYSAMDLYSKGKSGKIDSTVLDKMRLDLISAFQKSFELTLEYIYNDEFDKFGILEKADIYEQLTECLKLAGNNKYLSNSIKSKLLFLDACELSIGIRPGTRDYFVTEKLKDGINLLLKAKDIDPVSPYIYLKLGDYYLYTNQIDQSINSYLTYQRLLPNDEFSYNKLGLAYISKGKKIEAEASFKKALSLNPGFWQASDNLRIIQGK